MAISPLLLLFFGGLLIIFMTGRLLGYFIGLDKYFRTDEPEKSQTLDSTKKKRRKRRHGIL
ncbi:MAG TPA: hypothetical protein VHO46_09705 [Bacteroidales bacterium]|nr:hypothetical protein [Bacteroidales bacterium]